MVSSENVCDYFYLRDSDIWNTSETNVQYIRRFIVRKRAEGLKLTTINSYVCMLTKILKEFAADDFMTVTSEQIDEWYFKRMDEINGTKTKLNSFYLEVVTLIVFTTFLHGKRITNINAKPIKNTHKLSDYVTPAQINNMKNAALEAGDIRSAALIMTTYGTGARISELLDANVDDLDVKQYNAILKVSGKTGTRFIPFCNGLPELLNWLLVHPMRDKQGGFPKDTPIFCTYKVKGNVAARLRPPRAEIAFKKYARAAGIPDDVKSNPHAFRHRLASTLSKEMSVRELNMLFGWSDEAGTAMTYMHSDLNELENNILAINGISIQTPDKEPVKFVIQCPSCKKLLPPDAKWCPQCRLILDPVLAVKIEEVNKDAGNIDTLQGYLDYLKNDKPV